MSLIPSRVSLTHFPLSSHERALCLPTSFPISCLARLGVKPKLCKSSWRAFASIHPLMLPSISPWEALIACPPSPWKLLFFTLKSFFSSPCSRSDFLFLSKVRLSLTLTLSNLTIWLSGRMALFFFFTKATLEFLPTAYFVALRPLFPFRQAQYAQVFPLKPAPFCKLSADLGSINKCVISLLFSFSLTLALLCSFFRYSFYLNLSDRNCLLFSFVLSDYNGSPDTHVFRDTTRLMSWPDVERFLCLLHSLLAFLLSLESTLGFSRTENVLSVSTKKLVLPRHARCVLPRLRCNGQSLLLNSYLTKIGRI